MAFVHQVEGVAKRRSVGEVEELLEEGFSPRNVLRVVESIQPRNGVRAILELLDTSLPSPRAERSALEQDIVGKRERVSGELGFVILQCTLLIYDEGVGVLEDHGSAAIDWLPVDLIIGGIIGTDRNVDYGLDDGSSSVVGEVLDKSLHVADEIQVLPQRGKFQVSDVVQHVGNVFSGLWRRHVLKLKQFGKAFVLLSVELLVARLGVGEVVREVLEELTSVIRHSLGEQRGHRLELRADIYQDLRRGDLGAETNVGTVL